MTAPFVSSLIQDVVQKWLRLFSINFTFQVSARKPLLATLLRKTFFNSDFTKTNSVNVVLCVLQALLYIILH